MDRDRKQSIQIGLMGFEFEEVLHWVDTVCEDKGKEAQPIPYWDRRTAERITEVPLRHLTQV